MPVSADTLRLLMDAGVEGDELLRIVESIDKQAAPERSPAAVRQARYRANKKALSVTNDVTRDVTEGITPRARVEDISSNQETSGKSNKKSARNHLADFKAELSDLGDERLEAFVLHRRAKRGALTGYGGKLFRQDCSACGLSPAEGADMAMSRGWITVKPEWLSRPNSTAPPKKLTQGESLRNMARAAGVIDDTGSPVRRLEEGKRDGENPGVGDVIRLAVAGNHGWGTG